MDERKRDKVRRCVILSCKTAEGKVRTRLSYTFMELCYCATTTAIPRYIRHIRHLWNINSSGVHEASQLVVLNEYRAR